MVTTTLSQLDWNSLPWIILPPLEENLVTILKVFSFGRAPRSPDCGDTCYLDQGFPKPLPRVRKRPSTLYVWCAARCLDH